MTRSAVPSAGAVLAGVVLASSTLLGLPAAKATAAAHPVSVETGDDPIRRLGSCMASGQPTDVLIVFDRSSSLQDTDPENERITAARYLVERLIAVADGSGADMHLAVAGFDVDFEVTQQWTKAAPDRENALVRHVEGYAGQNKGWETDYWEAVQGARSTLADREKGGEHCQGWIWFSDGSYDLDVRDSKDEAKRYGDTKPYADGKIDSRPAADKAVKAGVSDLCRDGGQAAQLRARDIITLAVGLKTPGSDANFDLMKGIAEASGSGGPACSDGADPVPGTFIQASELNDVLFAFDEFSSPNQKPIDQSNKLCPIRACASEEHEFVLDNSIASVHILGTADADQNIVALQRDGMAKPILLDPGTTDATHMVGDVEVKSTWLSDDSIQLDMTRGSDRNWAGLWTLVFIDPNADEKGGESRSRIHLQGDIAPAFLDEDPQWHTGEKVDANLGLTRLATKESVAPSDIEGKAVVSATLYPNGAGPITVAEGVQGAQIAEPRSIDLTSVPIGKAVLRVTLDLTTKSARTEDGQQVPGTVLAPQSVDVPIRIQAPENYPTISPTLYLGTIEDLETVDGAVEITGPGCVWLDKAAPATTLPVGVKDPVISSSANDKGSCVKVADGEKATVPVSLTFDSLDNGDVNGAMTLMAVPEDGKGEAIPVEVDYTLEMRKPRDTSTFLLALIGITLAGVLIPVALLYLVKWLTSGIPGSSLLVGRVQGTVDADGRFLPSTGDALAVDPAAMDTVFLAASRRRVALPGGGELVAKVGLNPSAPGYVVANIPGRSAASSARKPSNKALGAVLPSAVAGSWVVAIEGTGSGAAAEVLFFTNPNGAGIDQLLQDARDRIPDVVTTLRSKAPGTQAGPDVNGPDNGWGGGSPAPAPTPTPQGGSDSWNNW